MILKISIIQFSRKFSFDEVRNKLKECGIIDFASCNMQNDEGEEWEEIRVNTEPLNSEQIINLKDIVKNISKSNIDINEIDQCFACIFIQ